MVRGHLNVDESLLIEGVEAEELADEYGTPLYVTSSDRIRRNYRSIYESLSEHYEKVKIHYACKANTNLSVLKILEEEGSCIDAVSPGEIHSALRAGFSPERILYTGTSVSDEELEYAIKKNVIINIDSINTLSRLYQLGGYDLDKGISIRVNPGIGAGHHDHCITGGRESKFGVWEDYIVEAYKKALDFALPVSGIHMHIGSGILEVEKFLPAVERLMDIAGKVSNNTEVDFEFIDIGGGLGIPYEPGEEPLDIDEFSKEVTDIFKRKCAEHELGEPHLILEPGRSIVGDSSVVLTRVNDKKQNPYRKFIGVDAGFHTLLRPAMYGSYHGIINASDPDPENAGNFVNVKDPSGGTSENADESVDIAGPLCESGDLIAENRQVAAEEGDLLAVLDVGAYGFSMTSRYNSRPLPAEVIVDSDGSHRLIRERESFDDLFEKQVE